MPFALTHAWVFCNCLATLELPARPSLVCLIRRPFPRLSSTGHLAGPLLPWPAVGSSLHEESTLRESRPLRKAARLGD